MKNQAYHRSQTLFGITASIENKINDGDIIDKKEYEKVKNKMQYKDGLYVDQFFVSNLYKEFGLKKVNEALDRNDNEPCASYHSLRVRKYEH